MDDRHGCARLRDLLPDLDIFKDRTDAGARLAERLDAYRGHDLLVLGIPRGGVPVAAEIARRLDAELDIVMARKLAAPFEPELAVGAVTADGGRYLNENVVREAGITDAYLAAVAAQEMAEARRREQRLRGTRPMPRMAGRTVIVVDDGLATGATTRAAVSSVRTRQPARLLVAIPVGPRSTCTALRGEADQVIVLYEPEPFLAVGYHYRDFRPIEERTVECLLQANWQHAYPVAAQRGPR
jgi:predicted phosphoribosyltransferase